MGDAMSAYTAGMVEAQGNNRNNDGMWGGGNWIWILVLFLLFSMLGNGWQNNGNTNRDCSYSSGVSVLPYLSLMSASANGAATRNDIMDAFAVNNLQRGIDGLARGVCDSTYALSNVANTNARAAEIQLCGGFNGMQRSLDQAMFQYQQCCCDMLGAIESAKSAADANACALQNTMNNNTRDIIDNQNTRMRELMDYLCQDKISTLQNEIQSLRLAASQSNQNAAIGAMIDASRAEILRRTGNDCPIPAYVVPNPNCCYGNPVGVSYGYNNGGCGCNNGCNTCGC